MESPWGWGPKMLKKYEAGGQEGWIFSEATHSCLSLRFSAA